MKLTKRQRHSYYKKALLSVRLVPNSSDKVGYYDRFICISLKKTVFGFGITTNTVPDLFPEFKKWKEKRKYFTTNAWWNPNNKSIRVRVLNQCIKETSPKKK